MAAQLKSLVNYMDRLLQHGKLGDYTGACNGLQLGHGGVVKKVVAAVDASPRTLAMAVGRQAQLLLVHHGLGWNAMIPLTGARHAMIENALRHGLAVYSSHLPLDAHAVLGNNVLLAKALGAVASQSCVVEKGAACGRIFHYKKSVDDLMAAATKALGSKPLLLPFGPRWPRRIVVITGGGGSLLERAVAEGADTLVTGEAPHWVHVRAQEFGMNVLVGGHYLTETFGVKALAQRVARRFRLKWEFLDDPSGL